MLPFKRPMKAASLLPEDVEHTDANILAALEKLWKEIPGPRLATLKCDGVRGFRANGTLLSCSLKEIPNRSIRARSLILPGGFDMELYNPTLSYNEIQSIVMSKEHPKSDLIQFHILDWFMDKSYMVRYYRIYDWCMSNPRTDIECLIPQDLNTPKELFNCFLLTEQLKGEGLCFRLPNSPYKNGRSTLKEQYLIKLCRYVRQEVRIIGFIEELYNDNKEKRNEIGLMKRQTLAANMKPKGTLGSFIVETIDEPRLEFTVGSGMAARLKQLIWDDKNKYFGKLITIKHKPHGQKILPRSPIFVGFRKEGY